MRKMVSAVLASAALLIGCSKDDAMVEVRGTIIGTVVATDGALTKGLEDVSVAYYEGATSKSVTTLADGSYAIGNVPPGKVTLTFAKGGYAAATTTVTVSNPYINERTTMPVIKGGGIVQVTANAEPVTMYRADADLKGKAYYPNTGEDYDPEYPKDYLRPLSGAQLTLVVVVINGSIGNQEQYSSFSSTTSNDGSFEFKGLPAVKAELTLVAVVDNKSYDVTISGEKVLASSGAHELGNLKFTRDELNSSVDIVKKSWTGTSLAANTVPVLKITFRKATKAVESGAVSTLKVTIDGVEATCTGLGTNVLTINGGAALPTKSTVQLIITNLWFVDNTVLSQNNQPSYSEELSVEAWDFYLIVNSTTLLNYQQVQYLATINDNRQFALDANSQNPEFELVFNRPLKVDDKGKPEGLSQVFAADGDAALDEKYVTFAVEANNSVPNSKVKVTVKKEGLAGNAKYYVKAPNIDMKYAKVVSESEYVAVVEKEAKRLYFSTGVKPADFSLVTTSTTLLSNNGQTWTATSNDNRQFALDINSQNPEFKFVFNRPLKVDAQGKPEGISEVFAEDGTAVANGYVTYQYNNNTVTVTVIVKKEGLSGNSKYYVKPLTADMKYLKPLTTSEYENVTADDRKLWFSTGAKSNELYIVTTSLYDGGKSASQSDYREFPFNEDVTFTMTFNKPLKVDVLGAPIGLDKIYKQQQQQQLGSQYTTFTTDADRKVVTVKVKKEALKSGTVYNIGTQTVYYEENGEYKSQILTNLYFGIEVADAVAPTEFFVDTANNWQLFNTQVYYPSYAQLDTSIDFNQNTLHLKFKGNANMTFYEYQVYNGKTEQWESVQNNVQQENANEVTGDVYVGLQINLQNSNTTTGVKYKLDNGQTIKVRVRAVSGHSDNSDGKNKRSGWVYLTKKKQTAPTSETDAAVYAFRDNAKPKLSQYNAFLSASSLPQNSGGLNNTSGSAPVQVQVQVQTYQLVGWEENNATKMEVSVDRNSLKTDDPNDTEIYGTVSFISVSATGVIYFNVSVTAGKNASGVYNETYNGYDYKNFTIKVKDSSGNESRPIKVQVQ